MSDALNNQAKTKLEIIEETAAFYNLGNRGFEPNIYLQGKNGKNDKIGRCKYKTVSGNLCAIGRCLKQSGPEYFLKEGLGSLGKFSRGNLDLFFTFLKEEYRGHSRFFWIEIQLFHDRSENWTEKGLSAEGVYYKNNLIKTFEIENIEDTGAEMGFYERLS